MRVLIDTNILIDYLAKRVPFDEDARQIILLCKNRTLTACIAAHSVMNAFYIMRKDFTLDERRTILTDLCELMTVVGIDKEKIVASLGNEAFTDIEDCLQSECAKSFSAEYIITRNIKDFKNSSIPAITPDVLLEKI